MRYVTIFPEYSFNIQKMDDLKKYRRKVINDKLNVTSLIKMLNSNSAALNTVHGHYVNKSFIIGVRDYESPDKRRSSEAKYERRNQVNLYVSMDLSTLEEVSGFISVSRSTHTAEACLERALAPSKAGHFIGILTDVNTTEKLDNMIDPAIQNVLQEANLSQSYFAVNKNMIKRFSLIKDVGDDQIEMLIQPAGKDR